MISVAIEVAREGNYVFYVCDSHREVERTARETAQWIIGCRSAGKDKVNVGQAGGSITFVSRSDKYVDLRSGRYVGSHPSCVFLADPYALTEAIREALPWAWKQLRDQHYVIKRPT